MISVCILTKNSAVTLEKTLESTRGFDEVILLDNGSTDSTFEIAARFPNVKVHKAPFIGFGPLRNQAASLARNEWVLALDSDEVLSEALVQEIQTLLLDPAKAYRLPRHNYYQGQRIRGCGWGSDAPARLYPKSRLSYGPAQVHESLLPYPLKTLSSPLFHTPYRSPADFLAKMNHYASLFAAQNQGRKSSLSKALLHASFAFFRSYVLKRGFLDGSAGLMISLHNANTTFYKYFLLL